MSEYTHAHGSLVDTPEGEPIIDYAAILRRLAEGESLRSVCRHLKLAESTVRLHLSSDPTLSAQYAHAREAQADHYAEKIVDEAFAATDAATGRLRMDALKWAASKLAPKRYGDKVTQEHVGPDGGAVKFERIAYEIIDPPA